MNPLCPHCHVELENCEHDFTAFYCPECGGWFPTQNCLQNQQVHTHHGRMEKLTPSDESFLENCGVTLEKKS